MSEKKVVEKKINVEETVKNLLATNPEVLKVLEEKEDTIIIGTPVTDAFTRNVYVVSPNLFGAATQGLTKEGNFITSFQALDVSILELIVCIN